MATDDDSPWSRQLLVGLAALVAVTLIVGGVLSLIALGAAKISGIGSPPGGASAPPSLYMPSLEPTTTPDPYPDPAPPSTGSASPSPSPSDSPTRNKPDQRITLQAYPGNVSPGQRIDLSGVYPRGEGAMVRVQRWANGWVDFPVSASVSGGIFHTYVTTSRGGPQKFRVLDPGTGRHSNPVTVRVS